MEMDLQTLQQLVNTMGFPIVMVCYFIWDKTKTTNKLVSAINNNNTILARLLEKMNQGELNVSEEQ